jgi:uncharacterized protein (TIGR02145 family)
LFYFSCSDDSTSSNDDELTGTITDIDGNIYKTVKIGKQWWMVENLKVTHYHNGDVIHKVTEDTIWFNLTAGAYCEYENSDTAAIYGLLYNWYAVDDKRIIAPPGWHVPNKTEWLILVEYLGGFAVAGGKMKEKGTVHWNNPNIGATNESGFSALPAGTRFYDCYCSIGEDARFWSSYMESGNGDWAMYLHRGISEAQYSFYNKWMGLSIRCIRD